MNNNPHNLILSNYQNALDEAENMLSTLAKNCMETLNDTILCIMQKDLEAAARVIKSEESLNRLSREIDIKTRNILLQFHPLARDLRHTISIVRCTERLNETAREMALIAKYAEQIIDMKSPEIMTALDELFTMAKDELGDSLTSFEKGNSALAISVRMRDKKLDMAHKKLIEKLITGISVHEYRASTGLQLLFIVRSIERIGDHAKSIAAAAIFQNEAKEVRHQKNNNL